MSRQASVLIVLVTLIGINFAQFVPHNIVTKWVETNNNLFFATSAFTVPAFLRGAYIMDVAMFDATSAYSKEITPFVAKNIRERPRSQHTDANRKKALSYAAYRVLKNLYGNHPAVGMADGLMASMGYNVNDYSTDLSTPAGIGNYAAQKMIESRQHDRMNANGDLPGTRYGMKYSDWTGYAPVNDPQAENGRTNCSELRDINHWQPLRYLGIEQVFDGAHIGLATPFSLENGFEFVPQGPALFNTNTEDEAMRQLQQIITISGSLGDRQKIIGEWIALNFFSNFAIFLAAQKQLSIVDTVKLMFLHGGAEWDSVVAAWAVKRLFDNARPISQVQCLFAGQTIQAWSGPYQGVKPIQGEDWQPYPAYDVLSPLFRTPNFPEYISGHSTSAGAVFEAYKRFFGSDNFGFSVTIPAGASVVEPKVSDPNDPRYVAGVTNVPNSGPATVGYSPAQPVTIQFATFSEAALVVAQSREYLGIHFEAASLDGISTGRLAGAKAFSLYSKHVTGKHDNDNNDD